MSITLSLALSMRRMLKRITWCARCTPAKRWGPYGDLYPIRPVRLPQKPGMRVEEIIPLCVHRRTVAGPRSSPSIRPLFSMPTQMSSAIRPRGPADPPAGRGIRLCGFARGGSDRRSYDVHHRTQIYGDDYTEQNHWKAFDLREGCSRNRTGDVYAGWQGRPGERTVAAVSGTCDAYAGGGVCRNDGRTMRRRAAGSADAVRGRGGDRRSGAGRCAGCRSPLYEGRNRH